MGSNTTLTPGAETTIERLRPLSMWLKGQIAALNGGKYVRPSGELWLSQFHRDYLGTGDSRLSYSAIRKLIELPKDSTIPKVDTLDRLSIGLTAALGEDITSATLSALILTDAVLDGIQVQGPSSEAVKAESVLASYRSLPHAIRLDLGSELLSVIGDDLAYARASHRAQLGILVRRACYKILGASYKGGDRLDMAMKRLSDRLDGAVSRDRLEDIIANRAMNPPLTDAEASALATAVTDLDQRRLTATWIKAASMARLD